MVLKIQGESPETIWVQSDSSAMSLHIERNKAYVAAWDQGLKIFDISIPENPTLLSALETPGCVWDVRVHQGYAYIADFNEGMTVINVEMPLEPRYVGTTQWVRKYQGAEVIDGEQGIVYIAAARNGLITIDVSNPEHPVVVSRYRPFRLGSVEGVAVGDGIVYLTMASEIRIKIPGEAAPRRILTPIGNGLHILDSSNPVSPVRIGKRSFLGFVEAVHIVGDYAYIANTWTGIRTLAPALPFCPLPFHEARTPERIADASDRIGFN